MSRHDPETGIFLLLAGFAIVIFLILAWVAAVTVTGNLSDWIRTVLP